MSTARQHLLKALEIVRQKTEELCQPLVTEDYVIQSIADVSPPKWHLAHTTWFFEAFILASYLPNYQFFHPSFHHLFNSYYQTVGQPYPREQRGLLSRPTVATVYSYRKYINEQLVNLIRRLTEEKLPALATLINLGLNHEQQHQELLLMDIKHNFFLDPNFPVYQSQTENLNNNKKVLPLMEFIYVEGGIVTIGNSATNFCFDNELPRHQKILQPFLIANRLVTNNEFCEFINADGYNDARWWLADGWELIQKNKWQAPLYWQKFHDKWHIFTLNGLKEIESNEPVAHVNFYEAEAYARWRGCRLPSETEWEHFVIQQNIPIMGNFLEEKNYHPRVISNDNKKTWQFFGDLWEWTTSAYSPYPGFKPLSGTLGEYNGKFMSNQMVLRGGSCLTAQNHIRPTYRNFFQPEKRWQFSGIRLAKNI